MAPGRALVRGHEVVRRPRGGQCVLQERDLLLLVRRVALRARRTTLVRHLSPCSVAHADTASPSACANAWHVTAQGRPPGTRQEHSFAASIAKTNGQRPAKAGGASCVPQARPPAGPQAPHVLDVPAGVVLLGRGRVRGDERVGVQDDAADGDLRSRPCTQQGFRV